MSNPTRQEFEAQIIAKAWKDEAFRRRLLTDPKAVYGEEIVALGLRQEMPAAIDIKILEETPTTLYLVLPSNPDTSTELTDAQLAEVAGGQEITRTASVTSSQQCCQGTFAWTCGWPCNPGDPPIRD